MTDDVPTPALARLFIVHPSQSASAPAEPAAPVREPALEHLRHPRPQWKTLARIGRRRRRGKLAPKHPA